MSPNRYELNIQLAQMLKGGVIMDVTNADQAKIAEDAGAVAVMALERVPSDIRKDGGVARMSDPSMIAEIKESVTIPVMAKARIGHFVEAVRHIRAINREIRLLAGMPIEEVSGFTKINCIPHQLALQVRLLGRFAVVN